ncbi:MAG: hypothetical protein ACLQFR_00915 [Streptosporangiaceae bacterium]
MGDFGRFVAAVAAGLVVLAGGAVAYPSYARATQQSGHAGAAAARQIPVRSAITVATSPVPDYGNPAGRAQVPPAARAVSTAHPNHVIGSGTPASCTSAALVRAVARGGVITFNCGPAPVTILMTATAKVVNTSYRVVIDGGGLITLSGGGKHRILYMNTCDKKQKWTTSDCWEQQWPQLVVQNLTFKDAYSGIRQTKTSSYGGGAIFDEGGQLKVVNSGFINNRCYKYGPDLGGAAIRALGMWQGSPVYITKDTFSGGRCSNGGALSSIDASWDVLNSLMARNKTTGNGENPQKQGTPGGGSGGAIYTDGDSYNVTIDGTIIRYNAAHGGEGGAVFFVVDSGQGTLKIEYSRLHHNPSGGYQNLPGIFDDVDQTVTHPVVIHSTIN